jgi:FtsH-binding integral membrane protein
MVNFNDVIVMLQRVGVADVLLPFILIFTIVFAVMQKAEILGDPIKNKKFHAIVALVLGLSVVIPHVTNSYPDPRYDVVNIINQSLPNVAVITVAIICVLVLLGLMGVDFMGRDPKHQSSALAITLWALSIGLIIFIFGSSAGWGWKIPRFLGFLNDKDTQALLIIILVFGGILAYIMKDDKGDNKDPFLKRFQEGFQRFRGDFD